MSSNASISNWWTLNGNVQILSVPLWIVPLFQDNHWQMLCILNPSPITGSKCIIYIMDSLIISGFPSNYTTIVQFAGELINCSQSITYPDKPISECPFVKPCLVPLQPNGFDCGVFAILNMNNAINHLDDLVHNIDLENPLNLCSWYTQSDGASYRCVLYQKFAELHCWIP
jgi:Ulp1 family protease